MLICKSFFYLSIDNGHVMHFVGFAQVYVAKHKFVYNPSENILIQKIEIKLKWKLVFRNYLIGTKLFKFSESYWNALSEGCLYQKYVSALLSRGEWKFQAYVRLAFLMIFEASKRVLIVIVINFAPGSRAPFTTYMLLRHCWSCTQIRFGLSIFWDSKQIVVIQNPTTKHYHHCCQLLPYQLDAPDRSTSRTTEDNLIHDNTLSHTTRLTPRSFFS